jgi:hypothetical protein
MKHMLVYVGAAFVLFQILLVLAVCATAKKPSPTAEVDSFSPWLARRRQLTPARERELEPV